MSSCSIYNTLCYKFLQVWSSVRWDIVDIQRRLYSAFWVSVHYLRRRRVKEYLTCAQRSLRRLCELSHYTNYVRLTELACNMQLLLTETLARVRNKATINCIVVVKRLWHCLATASWTYLQLISRPLWKSVLLRLFPGRVWEYSKSPGGHGTHNESREDAARHCFL